MVSCRINGRQVLKVELLLNLINFYLEICHAQRREEYEIARESSSQRMNSPKCI